MTEKSIYEDGTYLQNNPDWHQRDSTWKAERIARILAKNGVRPQTVAEIGCGAGEVLRSLSTKLGDEVEFAGFEISPQAYELSRTKASGNLSFALKDLLAEPEEVRFDVLMAVDVFEHVEDYYGFLRKMRCRATYKVFHIPLDLSVQAVARAGRLMYARKSVGHIHYFTRDIALAVLEDTGYEVVDSFYTCGSIDLPAQGWRAGLVKLPRRWAFALHEDLAVRVLGGFSLMVLSR